MPPRAPGAAKRGFLLVALVTFGVAPVQAQRIQSVGVRADNDGFNYLSRGYSDRDYTSGTEFTATFDDRLVLQLLSRGYTSWCASEAATCASRVTLGQKIFTPSVESPTPIPGERPFAGWLFLRLEERVVSGRNGHLLTVEIGVTGKPSLAEAVSQGLHDLIGFHQLVGWENQLSFEPGVTLSWDYDRVLGNVNLATNHRLSFTRTTGISIGNVDTEARVGAGINMDLGLSATAPSAGPRIAFSFSVLERLVLRNLFLDGNTFVPGVSVEKRTTVFSYTGAAEIRVGRFRAGYSVTTSAREYETQSARHAYSTFAVRYNLR